MPQLDALFQQCCLTPDDDAPRLVWADRVGGERGELVVIQCDLARGGFAPMRTGALLRRERELILRHGAAWSGLADVVPPRGRIEFRRGFVEAIKLDAAAFVMHSEAIMRHAPLLRSLTTQWNTVESRGHMTDSSKLGPLRAVFGSPAFGKLRGLHIVDDNHYRSEWVDFDEVALLLIDSGALAQLDSLAFSRQLSATGAHHLRASGELEHFEKLWLHASHAPDVVIEIVDAAPRLKELHLGYTDAEAVAGVLPPLTALSIKSTGKAIDALGRSCIAGTLEELTLWGGWFHLDGLDAFPKLRALDLGDIDVLPEVQETRDIAALLPKLRRLRFAGRRYDGGAPRPNSALRPMARALGGQLELLELWDMDYDQSLLDELRSYVVGYVEIVPWESAMVLL